MYRLPLRSQLIWLCGIFLVPLTILAGLLIQQARTDIAFSSKERAGVSYLKTIWPVIESSLLGAQPVSLAALRAKAQEMDGSMRSWSASSQWMISLEAGRPASESLHGAIELITAVGDGSNLILDPDLDSFYVMDLVIQRVPQLVLQIEQVDALLRSADPQMQAMLPQRITVLKGQIDASHKAIRASMDAAVRNNPGGELSATLLQPYSNAIVAIQNYHEDVARIASSLEDKAARPAVLANRKPLVENLSHFYLASLDALDILLAKRIAAKVNRLSASLIAAAVAALCAFLFAAVVARRISEHVQGLSERIRALTQGDFITPIPFQDFGNEIGTIARSLTVFREHAEEKSGMAAQMELERVQTQQRLEAIAYRDELTGLPNRKYLLDAIERHSTEADEDAPRHPAALIYFDLDGFKEVNDTATHQAGDELLRQVGERIGRLTRDRDLVARLGGDEFAMFVHVVDDQVLLRQMCERILQHLSEPYRIRGGQQYITASAGVAVIPTSNVHDGRELLRRADVAMYRAKADGKNRVVFFDSSFDSEMLYRKSLESALREGLQRGEVTLAFQPQMEAATSRLVGLEGLARWQSERHGEISPSVFIPIAESSGLIHELGRQVMHQAILACRRWPSLQISVNVSVAQLRHPDFINQIANAMVELSAPSNRIELEITESVVMEDDRMLTAKLAALRDLGFKLALDDFGTGYSSLSYLSRHRFDRLKIDRSFIRNIAGSHLGGALLQSIANLGRSLEMEVCAEGVESYLDIEAATSAGCTHLQGYYFSPAVTMAEIDKLVSNGMSEPADHNQVGGRSIALFEAEAVTPQLVYGAG